MTQPSTPERRTVNTTVQALGKQQSGDGWMLTLAYKLPGSKFPLNLYGKDWEQVKGLSINSVVDVIIQKGNLKQDKDPQYESSFFWNLVEAKPGTPAAGPQAAPSATAQPAAPKDPLEGQPKTGYEASQGARERGIDINVAINQGREAAQFIFQFVTRLPGDSAGELFFALWHECANEVVKMQRKARE